jgi:endonuclease/exonuclease/phosphatase family metal-dependent hydrolase
VIKVATYNIRHAQAMNDKVDLDGLARVILEISPDMIGLQEVDKGWARSGNVNQAKYLADYTGMYYVFSAAMKRGSSEFGNAVLSRFPILKWESVALPSTVREPRSILTTWIELRGRMIQFVTTHLGLNQQERIDHINHKLLPLLQPKQRVILTGDFNCLPSSPEVALINRVMTDTCPPDQELPTFPADRPAEKIDYIMHSAQFKAVMVEVVHASASDHLPLVSELAFPVGS